MARRLDLLFLTMRPYRIDLYSKDFVKETVFTSPHFRIRSFMSLLNNDGKALIEIFIGSPIAKKSNFQKYKRIKILRFNESEQKYLPKWSGYIESVIELDDVFQLGCVEMIGLFAKRLTNADRSMTGNGGTEAFGLLSYTNGIGDTAISQGNTDYSKNIDIKADYTPIFNVWQDIAKQEPGEFYIYPDTNELHFLQKVGADKTSEITLKYRQGEVGNNLEFVKIAEEGKHIVNRVIGIGKQSDGAKLVSVKEDTASQTKYGVLETQQYFDQAESQAQLDELTQAHLNLFKEEIDNPEIKTAQKRTITNIAGESKDIGIDLDDLNLGDTVTVQYKTDYNTFLAPRRIVEYSVNFDDTGNEDISLKLIEPDQSLEILSVNESMDASERVENLENAFMKNTY